MCGGFVQKIFGGGGDAPVVIRENPVADQKRIEEEAKAKAKVESQARKRRVKGSSLLATGGFGDSTDVVTGQPSAVAGKPTLGA